MSQNALNFLVCVAASAREGGGVHIKEFDMWSYTECENSWLAPSAGTETVPVGEDTLPIPEAS
jgi:hypothetical protein